MIYSATQVTHSQTLRRRFSYSHVGIGWKGALVMGMAMQTDSHSTSEPDYIVWCCVDNTQEDITPEAWVHVGYSRQLCIYRCLCTYSTLDSAPLCTWLTRSTNPRQRKKFSPHQRLSKYTKTCHVICNSPKYESELTSGWFRYRRLWFIWWGGSGAFKRFAPTPLIAGHKRSPRQDLLLIP